MFQNYWYDTAHASSKNTGIVAHFTIEKICLHGRFTIRKLILSRRFTKKDINRRVIQHENMSTIAYIHYKIIETYAQISHKYYVGVACFTKKRHKRTRDSALKHVDHTHKSLTNIMQVSRVSTNDKLSLSHLSIDRFYRCKHVFTKIHTFFIRNLVRGVALKVSEKFVHFRSESFLAVS